MILKKINFEYLLIIILALFFSLRAHYKEFNPYVIYPDMSSMAEYVNTSNQIKIEDVLSQELSRKENIAKPMKVTGLPMLIKVFYPESLHTVTAFKIFSAVLYLLAVLIMLFLTKKLFSNPIALTTTILFSVYILTMNTFNGGGLRSLGFCFLLLFLLSLYNEKYILASVILLFNMIYPYNIPLMGMLILIKMFNDLSLSKKNKTILLLVIGVVGIIILNLNFAGITALDILTEKNFNISLDYKYKLKIDGLWSDAPILNFIKHLVLNFQEHTSIYAFYTICLLSLSFLSRKKKHISELAIAALSSFLIISFFTNASVGSRIFLFAIPVILILNFGYILQTYSFDKPIKRKFLYLINFIIMMPFLLFFKPSLIDISFYEKTYNEIRKINQPHTLFFGHPETLEFMPFYTHKKPFTTVKLEYSFPIKEVLNYLEKKNKKIIEMLYSNDLNKIKEEIRNNNITHLVLEDYYYSKEHLSSKHWAYVKYGYLKDINLFIKTKNPAKIFVLYDFVKENYDFIDKENGIYLMDTKKLFKT